MVDDSDKGKVFDVVEIFKRSGDRVTNDSGVGIEELLLQSDVAGVVAVAKGCGDQNGGEYLKNLNSPTDGLFGSDENKGALSAHFDPNQLSDVIRPIIDLNISSGVKLGENLDLSDSVIKLGTDTPKYVHAKAPEGKRMFLSLDLNKIK